MKWWIFPSFFLIFFLFTVQSYQQHHQYFTKRYQYLGSHSTLFTQSLSSLSNTANSSEILSVASITVSTSPQPKSYTDYAKKNALTIVSIMKKLVLWFVGLLLSSRNTIASAANFETNKPLSSSSTTTSLLEDDYDPERMAMMKQRIDEGDIVVINNFVGKETINEMRDYFDTLTMNNRFTASGLSNKANDGGDQFGKRDRQISAVSIEDLERSKTLKALKERMDNMRSNLSLALSRPDLRNNRLGHELYFSKSLPGTSLALHTDDRHEELKGRRGWTADSRRSISWLIYFSDEDWDINENGGALRVYPQKYKLSKASTGCGCHDTNLQYGWLCGTSQNINNAEIEPVFLDCWRREISPQEKENEKENFDFKSALYTYDKREGRRNYITHDFDLHSAVTGQILEVGELPNEIFLDPKQKNQLSQIEDLQLWRKGIAGKNIYVKDISPKAGTLVLFDSVALPHEVMQTLKGHRLALAGWMHEQVQKFPV